MTHKTKALEFINQIIPHRHPQQAGFGQAPVNIALSKYWGKRDVALNLPTNSSLSISLPKLGTQTTLEWQPSPTQQADLIILNGKVCTPETSFAQRTSQFLDYFRPAPQALAPASEAGYFKVETINTVPTAAGLASSASGYAALVLALNEAFNWQLDLKQLSLLARLGSGSASRSLFNGFAIWHQGQQENGLDSYAEPLPETWPELCIGLLEIDLSQKPIGSTEGMQKTVKTCEIYQAWPKKAEKDVQIIQQAIQTKDFSLLGQTAENNALTMHATMLATWPPICYWQPESLAAMHKIWALRQQGLEVYFTMDAGPNLKLLCLEKDQQAVCQAFESLKILRPFQTQPI